MIVTDFETQIHYYVGKNSIVNFSGFCTNFAE